MTRSRADGDPSVGVLLVGAGRIAVPHAEALAGSDAGHLVAVTDPLQDAAVDLADRFGARPATNLEEALADPDVDAVIVCAPTAAHERITLAAIAAGKHVLVEKPLADGIPGATRMIKAAADADVHVMAAQIVRFLPLFTWAKAFVDEGRLGRPLQFIERRLVHRREHYPWWDELPNFLVAHWGSHSVDLLCHLLDDTPVRAYCEAESVSPDYDVVDDFNLHLRLAAGTRAGFHMSFTSRATMHDMILVGEEHTLAFDCYASVAVDGEVALEMPQEEMLRVGFDQQLAHFLAVVDGTAVPRSAAASVLPSLRGLAAAEESIRTAAAVTL